MLELIFSVCISVGSPVNVPERVWYNLCVAIATVESGLNPNAISPTGDYGLFQINKKAHPRFFSSSIPWNNPEHNARYAIKHLKYLLESSEGGWYGYDIQTALARYNAGNNVEEGLAYADKILNILE